MRNIRLILAYDGTDFHGWQRQPSAPTIQACLEEAIHKLTGAPASVHGSGRTDAGVHASHQVANFHTDSPIPGANLVKALNDLLPPTVRVKAADEAALDFHARYDARRKTYQYWVVQTPVCSPFLRRFVCHYSYPLDRARMVKAARYFLGEHNFSSFAATEGRDNEGPGPSCMVRVIFRSRLLWRPRRSILIYDVAGNGFLHHMVRNIVGTLMEVGRRRIEPDDMPGILAACDRTRAGPTAPAEGLCLVKVEYA